MTIHVCAPPGFAYRTVRYCPTCDQRRRMVAIMYVWYPTDVTCLTCGDAWSDGERAPRPFARGWRTPAAARAKRAYSAATSRREALAALMDEVCASFEVFT